MHHVLTSRRKHHGPSHPLDSAIPAAARMPGRVVIIAAHPDDEAIGAGGHLPLFSQPWVLYVTNGAPRNPSFAEAAGFRSPEQYASARKAEALAALELAGIPASRIRSLGLKDQEASFHLIDLAHALYRIFEKLAPVAVFTHPYEGGHPDHDATALAVRAACLLFDREAPTIVEFTSYHNSAAGIAVSDFIGHAGCPAIAVQLSDGQCDLKRRMFESYHSQEEVLRAFPIAVERFRQAPAYRFTEPPHPGKLFYENFDWGMDGERWRGLAAQALDHLGLGSALRC